MESVKKTFSARRSYLSKYVNLLMKTKNAELGYAIDSKVYGIPEYTTLHQELAFKVDPR